MGVGGGGKDVESKEDRETGTDRQTDRLKKIIV